MRTSIYVFTIFTKGVYSISIMNTIIRVFTIFTKGANPY